MKILSPYKIKDLELKNRSVMAPMCMYSSDGEGRVKDFHRIHYASRALGGVALIIVEATAIRPDGRISNRDLAIWSDDHIEGLKSLADSIKENGSRAAIQLAHAGRKCGSGDEPILAPSPLRFSEDYQMPKEASLEEIRNLVLAFRDGARRALEAGFDSIEIHAAHGYLIHEFLSPLTNKREDQYGGSLENRTRFLREILEEVREIWPEEKPILLRVSSDDYKEGGIDKEEMVRIINQVRDLIDLVHVSTGGLVPAQFPVHPGYQVPHAETIKRECQIPTIAVGLIESADHMEDILANGRADLIGLGRPLLRKPYFILNLGHHMEVPLAYPKQYERGFPNRK